MPQARTFDTDPAAMADARRMHPVTLRFADAVLERHFRDARIPYRFTAGKISALAGALAWSGFTLLNAVTIEDASGWLLAVRLVAIFDLVVIFAAHLVFPPGRWIEPVGFFALIVNILLSVLVIMSMSEISLPYSTPAAVFTMGMVMSFALGGVTFMEGLVISSFAFLCFGVTVTWILPQPPTLIVFQTAWMVTTAIFAGLGFYFLDRTQRIAWLRQLDLIAAQEQIRSLLHNVLPPTIAERKLAGESPIADSFAQASLLFADVVGFTPLSSKHSSREVVQMLNDLFGRFDWIVARHGLEKIKTIGDCYMVAGGLPDPLPDHLGRMSRAAIEMQRVAGEMRTPDGDRIRLRIGMHVGPVTAGVIGQAKFAFDVWGDTVNMASRMESHGEPDEIRVTEDVVAALEGAFTFAGPETVEIKGKGPVNVWTLTGAADVVRRTKRKGGRDDLRPAR
jgi:class 3 adenylate cyclase